jgi:hypothetical protein
MKLLRTASFALPILLSTACGEAPREITSPASNTATKSSETEMTKSPPPLAPGAEKAPLPPSHPPIDTAPKPLVFKAPAEWVSEKPGSPMRREQYRLAKQGNDTADATVTVIPLPAKEGGPIEGNLDRWASQFTQPDGKSSREVMKQSTRKLGGSNVIDIDLSGTYVVNEAAMGGGSKVYNEPNWRMLLSWIQSPAGNYYVKIVGPAATVAHWQPSFEAFVSSASP